MTPILDFDIIDINQLDRLLVIDQSDWYHLETEKALLEITVPGHTKPYILNFTKGKNTINSYTSNLITPNCNDGCRGVMLDGVYKITLKICGETTNGTVFQKTKYFLRTTDLEKIIDKVILNKEVNNQPYKNQMVDVLLNIRKAKASLREYCLDDIMIYYSDAKEILDRMVKDLKILL